MEDSIVVIQCAGRKQPNAGHLQNNDGRKVMFVAKPNNAPKDVPYAYAHPDGSDDAGEPWREKLLRYNDTHRGDAGANPLGLLPAWQLYQIQPTGCFTRSTGRMAYTSFRQGGD